MSNRSWSEFTEVKKLTQPGRFCDKMKSTYRGCLIKSSNGVPTPKHTSQTYEKHKVRRAVVTSVLTLEWRQINPKPYDWFRTWKRRPRKHLNIESILRKWNPNSIISQLLQIKLDCISQRPIPKVSQKRIRIQELNIRQSVKSIKYIPYIVI